MKSWLKGTIIGFLASTVCFVGTTLFREGRVNIPNGFWTTLGAMFPIIFFTVLGAFIGSWIDWYKQKSKEKPPQLEKPKERITPDTYIKLPKKRLSVWLRGGLIGGIIGLISIFIGWVAAGTIIEKIIFFPLSIKFIYNILLSMVRSIPIDFGPTGLIVILFLYISFHILFFFILGSLIGLIISKFKKPKNIKGGNSIK